MKLKYAHLADYAGAGANGKMTVVGIFDHVFTAPGISPVPFPPCHLLAVFEASVAEGSDHRIRARILNADEEAAGFQLDGELTFYATGPGHPMRAVLSVGLGPGVLSVPAPGDYCLAFWVDGARIGEAPFSVLVRPGA